MKNLKWMPLIVATSLMADEMNPEQVKALAYAMTVESGLKALEACENPNPDDYKWILFCMKMHRDVIEQKPEIELRQKLLEQNEKR